MREKKEAEEGPFPVRRAGNSRDEEPGRLEGVVLSAGTLRPARARWANDGVGTSSVDTQKLIALSEKYIEEKKKKGLK